MLELEERGEPISFAEVRRQLDERDSQDRNRATSPLTVAPDAVQVDTTHLTIPEAIEEVQRLVDDALRSVPDVDTPDESG